MTKMIFVNLPITDLEASIGFCKALGFEQNLHHGAAGAVTARAWDDDAHAHSTRVPLPVLQFPSCEHGLPGWHTLRDGKSRQPSRPQPIMSMS